MPLSPPPPPNPAVLDALHWRDVAAVTNCAVKFVLAFALALVLRAGSRHEVPGTWPLRRLFCVCSGISATLTVVAEAGTAAFWLIKDASMRAGHREMPAAATALQALCVVVQPIAMTFSLVSYGLAALFLLELRRGFLVSRPEDRVERVRVLRRSSLLAIKLAGSSLLACSVVEAVAVLQPRVGGWAELLMGSSLAYGAVQSLCYLLLTLLLLGAYVTGSNGTSLTMVLIRIGRRHPSKRSTRLVAGWVASASLLVFTSIFRCGYFLMIFIWSLMHRFHATTADGPCASLFGPDAWIVAHSPHSTADVALGLMYGA